MNNFKKENRFLDLVKQQDDKFDDLTSKIDDLSKNIKYLRKIDLLCKMAFFTSIAILLFICLSS
ncbi:hypothetical protein [Francisella noatunensis]|uniref:Uncharacterized protein n=1 Tax=Francisella noatunensis TaxID=657445 RepID=A0A9Q2QI30_9GAMM|nr:hypothetical protein [Francisella noatunensis]MBK2050755.1 hypothetical protein [Francisella noatunensis]MBK2054697.1 hypothetical protein [Francisella noatunensis]MBK2056648.1 hypothetical protein [Francisella noatunensis]MBK2058155.1 hypothetical protein [Francisella noatunensis]MBK2059962.1 hypothetical protein [Francisella noatunensis]